MKNKKIINLIVLIILPILLGIFLIAITRKPAQPSPDKPAPTPNIPKLYEETLPIKLKVEKKDVDIPLKISAMTVTNSLIKKESAVQIAANLGFDFLPTEIDDVIVGKKLFWKDEISYLSISLEIGEIYFGQHFLTQTANKQLSDTDLLKQAEEFVNTNFPNQAKNYKTSAITYLKDSTNPQGTPIKTDKNNADYFKVSFLPLAADLEIITLVPNLTPFSAALLPDGSVYYARLSNITTSKKSEIEYSLRSYEDITVSLNEVSLINIEGSFIPVSEIQPNTIQEIIVDEITLAYLWDSANENLYLPVFLLKGPINIAGVNQELKAQLYLPAIKTP